MEPSDGLLLLSSRLPVALANGLHHGGGEVLQGCGVVSLEEVNRAELVLVHDIHIVEGIPELLVDDGGLHNVPRIGIADGFVNSICRSSALFELLTHIGGVEDGGASFDADRLLDLLRLDTTTVAQIGEVAFGILTRDVTYGEGEPAHKLIDVIQA